MSQDKFGPRSDSLGLKNFGSSNPLVKFVKGKNYRTTDRQLKTEVCQ